MLPHVRSLIGALGHKRLPVFEMDKATVLAPRLSRNTRWKSVTKPKGDLRFRGVQLAHAVVKSDFLEYRNPLLPGIGFVLQSHHIVDWSRSDLCLQIGGSTLLSDFARTSMTGRVGQGLALLFAYSQGYVFTAHLREYLQSQRIPVNTVNGRPLAVADFVCDGKGRAVVEAKSSFSVQRNEPSNVKRVLKKALNDQVSPWMKRLNPVATKSFVVGSYLREHSNPRCDASALVFVDPEGDGGGGDIEMSPATVRRENYAAWLCAMGLLQEAERMRSRESQHLGKVSFVVFRVGERTVAFPERSDWSFLTGIVPHRELSGRWFAAGIHLDALKALQAAARGDDARLLDYRPLEYGVDEVTQGDGDAYSVFPDGTFLGSFAPRTPVTVVEVEL